MRKNKTAWLLKYGLYKWNRTLATGWTGELITLGGHYLTLLRFKPVGAWLKLPDSILFNDWLHDLVKTPLVKFRRNPTWLEIYWICRCTAMYCTSVTSGGRNWSPRGSKLRNFRGRQNWVWRRNPKKFLRLLVRNWGSQEFWGPQFHAVLHYTVSGCPDALATYPLLIKS